MYYTRDLVYYYQVPLVDGDAVAAYFLIVHFVYMSLSVSRLCVRLTGFIVCYRIDIFV